MFFGDIYASDSLRTVSEFGRRVFRNLNYTDTLNGASNLDSVDVQTYVRDAVTIIGSTIGRPRAKIITTTANTMAYEIDEEFNEIRGVIHWTGKLLLPLTVYSDIEELIGAMKSQFTLSDSIGYNGCAIHGDSIYLHPLPRDTDTMYVFYQARATYVDTFSNTVTLPIETYQSVEWMATLMAAGKVSNTQAINTYTTLLKIGGKSE